MRQLFVYREGLGVIPIEKAPPKRPLHYVIQDTIDPVRSMADGHTYDSKSALRLGYKAAGVEEVGNEPFGLRGTPTVQDNSFDADIERFVEAVYARR